MVSQEGSPSDNLPQIDIEITKIMETDLWFVCLPVSGEVQLDESDGSSIDGEEVERGAMASSSSNIWDWLQLSSEERDAAVPQRPATAQSGCVTSWCWHDDNEK